jgi:hypothetical protein
MTNQTNKKDPNNGGSDNLEKRLRSIWLGMRDSNPRSRNQNPLPYHLANPHWICCYRG